MRPSLLATALSVLTLALGLAGTGCSKSKCEKYADMEVKCGSIPEGERDLTRQLAQGMCAASESGDDPDMAGMDKRFLAEAACAAKTDDCAAYKVCTDAIK